MIREHVAVYCMMVKTLFTNRYLDAAAKTLLCFVVIHWIVLLALIIRDRDWNLANAFVILDLHQLWPSLGEGIWNFLLGGGFVVGVFFVVYRSSAKK
jgi:hypothetical protein